MPVVVLPDGTHVNLPDAPQDTSLVKAPSSMPSWVTDAIDYGPGFLAESGRKVAASAGTALNNQMKTFADLPGGMSMAMKLLRKQTGDAQPTLDKIDVPLPSDASKSEQYYDSALRSTGQAVVTPVAGAGILANTLPGVASGLGKQAGGDYAANISPKLRGLGEFLGGAAAGIPASFALGPRQSPARADIRRAFEGAPEDTFDIAARKANEAKLAGSTTNTAAEAFPQNSAVMTLAQEARGGNASNALRLRTENRPEDLQNLGEKFLNNISPEVDANKVANQAGGSANSAMDNLKQIKSDAIRNRMGDIKPINPLLVNEIHDQMNQAANAAVRPGEAQAMRHVASALLDQHGNAITDPQQLSLALVALRKAASNPNNPVYQTGAVDKVDFGRAIDAARDSIGHLRPGFTDALNDFEQFSNQVQTPMRQGPIGSLSDRNPLVAGQTPVTKLQALLTGNSPQTVENTARTLNDPHLTLGNTTNPLDIARALAQQKLGKAPLNPGASIRGNPGSNAEEQFNALLAAGGKDAKAVTSPLHVADDLQAFATPAGRNEPPIMSLAQFIRPFRTADMMLSGHSQRSTQKEMAELLADPNNISELQKIAMFDPNIRRALTLRGLLLPAQPNKDGN